MTDHLPECEAYRDECGGGCICHHVRACEQRVDRAADEPMKDAYNDGYSLGYDAALDAAREAVRDLGAVFGPFGEVDAVAAIDALREEKK